MTYPHSQQHGQNPNCNCNPNPPHPTPSVLASGRTLAAGRGGQAIPDLGEALALFCDFFVALQERARGVKAHCVPLGNTVPVRGEQDLGGVRTGVSNQLSKGTHNLHPPSPPSTRPWPPPDTEGPSHPWEGSVLGPRRPFVPAMVSEQDRVLSSERPSACPQESSWRLAACGQECRPPEPLAGPGSGGTAIVMCVLTMAEGSFSPALPEGSLPGAQLGTL